MGREPVPEQPREPLKPALFSVREAGYSATHAKRDVAAGATVAIVALPLSMAIAIASGLPPEHGLFAAIVGGFLISLLGGSTHQIGGPAGAFIVVVAAIIERHGVDGLLLATLLAGLIMLAVGLLRLGTYVRLVPAAVTVGFTTGIGLIIAASQLKELLGLTLAKEPGALLPKLAALWAAASTINLQACALSIVTILLVLGLRRWRPTWPAFLIAIVVASFVAVAVGLDVATIGSRFGGIPSALPAPAVPLISWDKVVRVLPDALAIALLGSIESLLSAVVADKMSGLRHRSNIELCAQGIANMAAASFAAMPVTGTIARTATNVRAGGTSPVAGMLHAVFLLAILAFFGRLAVYVPLAGLAALLIVTSWAMIEHRELAHMLRHEREQAAVAIVTALATVFFDLLSGIAAGIALSIGFAGIKRARRT